nr:glycoside hydrolase family 19 protein [uncultured Roseateles sp.]
MITLAVLIAVGVAPAIARPFVQPLAEACARFEIATPARQAAFLGQCVAETGNLVHTEENLYYSMPERVRQIFSGSVHDLSDAATLCRNPQALASRVYAGRLGNGDEASGDGWRYRGRGLIQLTGRDHYADAGEALGLPYLDQPQLVAEPLHACLTAAWYWHVNKLNVLADSGQVDAITKAVNGAAMLHRDLRRQLTQDALAAMA